MNLLLILFFAVVSNIHVQATTDDSPFTTAGRTLTSAQPQHAVDEKLLITCQKVAKKIARGPDREAQRKVFGILSELLEKNHVLLSQDESLKARKINHGISFCPALGILDAIAERAHQNGPFHMLDVGAGLGWYSAFAAMTRRVSPVMVELSESQIKPLENCFRAAVSFIDPALLKSRNDRDRFAVRCMNILDREKFPEWWTKDGGAFEIATAGMVMHFFNGPETLQFLRDMNNVLKADGLLCITTSNIDPNNHIFKRRIENDELFPGMMRYEARCKSTRKSDGSFEHEESPAGKYVELSPSAIVGINGSFMQSETLEGCCMTTPLMTVRSLQHHTQQSITRLLKLCGFEVVSCETLNNYGYQGALAVIAQKKKTVNDHEIQALLKHLSQYPATDGMEDLIAEGWFDTEVLFNNVSGLANMLLSGA